LPKRGYRFLAAVSEDTVPEPPLQHRVRLVLLPFANVGGDPADEYFSDSMTDEIITALCQVAPENLAVIARTTAMHYKNSSKDVAHIGRELGVGYVVEGGVRREGGQVAMNVQLIQATDQAHIFAAKYNSDMRAVFGLPSRIAEDIAAHIPSVFGHYIKGRVRKKPTDDLQAYEMYLQGRRHIYKQTPETMTTAKRYFEDAVARDPRFALAYDALAEYYWWTGFWGFLPPRQACFMGLGLVLRSLEIDPSLAETHALLGRFRQKVDYNWPEVRREMRLALELDPSSPEARIWFAVSDLLPHAELEEAIRQAEYAIGLDPLAWEPHFWLSCFLWLARDYDRAMQQARFYEEIYPQSYMAHFMIGDIYRDSGRFEESIEPQRRAVELSGGAPQMLGWLGLNLAKSGKTAEARSILRQLETIAGERYVLPTNFVWIYVGLEEYDSAFAWMERAIDDRDSIIIPIKSYAFFDPMRSDPRFLALLHKMNLEP
jgi:TolB-like protein/tetratricopeptide (TPR) repeat protein